MADTKRGPIAGFFVGLWNLINFARRLVLNILFLLVLLVLFLAMRGGGATIAERTTLVLDPKGALVEQYTSAPAERAFAGAFGGKVKEVQLRDVVRAIDAAAADKRIERLVIEPDELGAAGMASLREVGAAIERFKAAGKEVVAVSNSMSQGQYLFAVHANQILLHPDGDLLLEGIGRYRTYYKDALDFLGIDVYLFRVGEYKSYAEPYIRNDASPESKEADLYWMNGVWSGYLKEVGLARHLDPAAISAQIENYPVAIKAAKGDLAKLALDSKLVDTLATRDEADAMLIAKGVRDEHSYRKIGFQDYLGFVDRELPLDTRPQVAVVVAEGEILGGDQPAGTVGGISTATLLRHARENSKVRAVVLRVNSPGGDAFASELIRREVELTRKAGKPVFVSMGDVAASGGYWISMNGERIFAEPDTITGSIGIFGLFASAPRGLEKLKIHTDGVATTSFAGAIDPRRALDPKVQTVIQSIIDKGYQSFITRVAEARGKSPQQVNEIARGRVWSGAQAKERGLVDEIGGLRDAVAAAAKAANLGDNYQTRYIEKEISAWERVLLSMSNDALARIGRTVVPSFARTLLAQADTAGPLRLIESMDANKVGVFAYCFCEMK